MSSLFVFMMLLSVLSAIITVVMTIIKWIKKRPLKKTLTFTGLSVIIFIVSFICFGITYEEKDTPPLMDKPNATSSTENPPVVANTDLIEMEVVEAMNSNNIPTATETIGVTDDSDVQNNTENKKYKYSGDKLKQALASYMSTKKDSEKNKLKESNPAELYELILANLKNEYSKYNTVKSPNAYNYFKDSCSVYIEINSDSAESANLKEIRDYVDQIYKSEQELTKLKSKYGANSEDYLRNFYSEFGEMEFYVVKKLDTSFGDTVTGKILKEIDAYKQSTPTQYLATTDYTYNEILGYIPGEDYCIIRPLDKFSKDGLYTLSVKAEGSTTLVNVNGFESEATVYLELDDKYISSLTENVDNYYSLSDDLVLMNLKLKSLLGINVNSNSNNYASYSGYWESNKHHSDYLLSLQIEGVNVNGELIYWTENSANSAEFEGVIENNQMAKNFEDSFGYKGSFTLTFIEGKYILINLEYSDGGGYFPQGENLMTPDEN